MTITLKMTVDEKDKKSVEYALKFPDIEKYIERLGNKTTIKVMSESLERTVCKILGIDLLEIRGRNK